VGPQPGREADDEGRARLGLGLADQGGGRRRRHPARRRQPRPGPYARDPARLDRDRGRPQSELLGSRGARGRPTVPAPESPWVSTAHRSPPSPTGSRSDSPSGSAASYGLSLPTAARASTKDAVAAVVDDRHDDLPDEPVQGLVAASSDADLLVVGSLRSPRVQGARVGLGARRPRGALLRLDRPRSGSGGLAPFVRIRRIVVVLPAALWSRMTHGDFR
jgi:hypothetical protein